jgi:hypothetical protein
VIARRLAPLALVLAIVASVVLLPAAGASTGGPAGAQASKRKCPKGKKLVVVKKDGKVVRKNGKPVKKCVKRKPKPTPCRTASASCATPAPATLFEAPGRKLEGNDAKPFLEKYLFNSTFTDCPAGWPNCSVEQRYSHSSSGYFYYCRLTSVSGADIINGAKRYEVKNAVVEPDGSWTFNENVENSGGSAFYEWHVATNGVVNGAYQFNGGGFEQLGPFQYLGGVAKDCSY